MSDSHPRASRCWAPSSFLGVPELNGSQRRGRHGKLTLPEVKWREVFKSGEGIVSPAPDSQVGSWRSS